MPGSKMRRRSVATFVKRSLTSRIGNKARMTLLELRQEVTFAILAETKDIGRVTAMVDALFTLLERGGQD